MLDILCSDYIDGIGSFRELLFPLGGSDDSRVKKGLQVQFGKIGEVLPMDESRGKDQEQTGYVKKTFKMLHSIPYINLATNCKYLLINEIMNRILISLVNSFLLFLRNFGC
jgi:hypothetical protein